MTDEAGAMSIDFLAGFTIFMIAFIYVATLIPGLFIGLQSRTIDYDAVAYRTGVILVEDPGEPDNPSWHTLVFHDEDVLRFGLALKKDTPNILSSKKTDRFFCSTWTNENYHDKAVFGDYPYKFNISLQMAGENDTRSIGSIPPEGYGYSRRIIKIKQESNTTIGSAQITQNPDYRSNSNSSVHLFSIYFNYTHLAQDGPDQNNPAYQINPISPLAEGVTINLTDLNRTTWDPAVPTAINLSSISIYRSRSLNAQNTLHSAFAGPILDPHDATPYRLFIDGNTTAVITLPQNITSNLSLVIPPGLLSTVGNDEPGTWLNVTLQFKLDHDDWFLNSTRRQPYGAFEYTYDPKNVTQPSLRDGVMEVAVW